jgi:serine/threonine-protein kinase
MSMTSPVADPLFLAFQLALAGRYSIDRELGRGGMGVVYLAREVHLDRPVAIKLLPPERAEQPSLRERFLREARLAAKLSHPNIIPIHAVEERGGFVFFVMAFVDGETLAHRVRTRGPLPSSEGARVLREVAWALAYAHDRGIVHRDVKPDNILLETATGRVLVADFGIATVAGDATDGVDGTPEFMSPEQALGAKIDARSDLYALGATAFYALSGRFPFEGTSATEILAKQVTEPAPPLSSLGITVPRKLATIVDRCMTKEPEHRPASAQAVAEQLGVALEQRRELPAALRSFVKRQARLNGGGSVIAGFALLPASIGVSSLFGGVAGFATFLLGFAVAPFSYFVAAARRLMLLGFTHADIGPAFKAEMEQAKEELAAEHRARSETDWLERWLPRVAKVGATIWALVLPTMVVLRRDPVFGTLTLIFGLSGGSALLSAIGALALQQRHRDIDTELWAKLWMGRIGKLAFSVARRFLGDQVHKSSMTHRATELSLGLAAEQLYESLPKETRQALVGLPALLARLQDDAQALRKHYDELQETLAVSTDEASSAEYAQLRATRDAAHAKLGEAVGALETIRLELLRLHAGSATVEGLTTHLGLAAEVSNEVRRLIAARDEVERV